jgi:hypothetical protein
MKPLLWLYDNTRHLEKLKTKKRYPQKLLLYLKIHLHYVRAAVKLVVNGLNVGM